MVQGKLEQMIRERQQARHEERKKARRRGTKVHCNDGYGEEIL